MGWKEPERAPGFLRVRILRHAMGAIVVLAGLAMRPHITLGLDQVDVAVPTSELLAHLREELSGGSGVIAGDQSRVVRRFSGRAGWWRYHTVEIVSFEAATITFEHVRGPFADCRERFDLTPTTVGTRLTHSGTFSLRGGLWSWPFGVLVVKRAFETHVREHLRRLREELRATA